MDRLEVALIAPAVYEDAVEMIKNGFKKELSEKGIRTSLLLKTCISKEDLGRTDIVFLWENFDEFDEIWQNFVDIPVVIVLVDGSKAFKKAVIYTRLGASFVVPYPFEEELLSSAVRASLSDLGRILRVKARSGVTVVEGIVAASSRMKRVLKMAEISAKTDAPVLIIGPTGVGKEKIADYIHRESRRRGKIVKVNCASIPEGLLEAELFGFEKGAFTGAVTSKKGLIEEADGGTLFLDEIDKMPFDLQAKLLRVLQDKRIRRLGSSSERLVDFRLIAAAGSDLYKLSKEGKFREDLYWRIAVIRIDIPPLKERRDDIVFLTYYIVKRLARKYEKKIEGVSKEVMKLFLNYSWSGNVRELENVLEFAVLVSRGKIELSDLPRWWLDIVGAETGALEYIEIKKLPDIADTEENVEKDGAIDGRFNRNDLIFRDAERKEVEFEENTEIGKVISDGLFVVKELVTLEELEKMYYRYVLEKVKYNISKAARILGVDRKTVYAKIEKYGWKIDRVSRSKVGK